MGMDNQAVSSHVLFLQFKLKRNFYIFMYQGLVTGRILSIKRSLALFQKAVSLFEVSWCFFSGNYFNSVLTFTSHTGHYSI